MTNHDSGNWLSGLEQSQQKLARLIDGPSPVEKHILLVRLDELVKNTPEIASMLTTDHRRWLARIGAVFSQLEDKTWRVRFNSQMDFINDKTNLRVNRIIGYAIDVIEILKLELELDGRSEIGTVYEPGDSYRYFADVKEIIAGATSEIFLVDPFFDGEIFDDYFGKINTEIRAHLLVCRYANDLQGYVQRHEESYRSKFELRRNKHDLHDRILFVDGTNCWITGGSFKDAGNKASYLIPVGSELTTKKYQIYREIWGKSTSVFAPDV